MFQNTKVPKSGLLLAGIAAFAYYKYSKMSAEEKENLLGDLKSKGQKLYDEYMPEQVKSMFAQKGYQPSTPANAEPRFGEGSDYAN